MLTLLPEPKLNTVYSIGVEYYFGRGVDRVSKVVELCIRLWHQITKPLGIERGYGSILLATAILQDVECIVSESNHSEKSVNILEKRMEELRRVFTLHEIMLMKTLILLHEINVLVSVEKLRSLGLSDNEIGQVLSVLKILRVATILVKLFNNYIDDISINLNGERIAVKIYSTVPFIHSMVKSRNIKLNVNNVILQLIV